jgi:hypothetical protein
VEGDKMNNRHLIAGLLLFAFIVMPVSDSYAVEGLIYKYDSMNRLVGAESNKYDEVYVYDGVGNRMKKYQRRPDYRYNEILVRFKIEISDTEILSIVTSQGGQILKVIRPPGESIYYIRMGDDQFGYTAVAQWQALPQVESVELIALRYPLDDPSYEILPLKIVRTGAFFYSIADAYNASADGDTIQVQAVELYENITINRNISVSIDGGYDEVYSAIAGVTSIKGMIQTMPGGGVLNIKNIRIDTSALPLSY